MNLDEKLEFRFYFRDWKDKLLLIIAPNIPSIPFNRVIYLRNYYIPRIEQYGHSFRFLKNGTRIRDYIYGYFQILPKYTDKVKLLEDLCQWLHQRELDLYNIDFPSIKDKEKNISLVQYLFGDFMINTGVLRHSAFEHVFIPKEGELYYTTSLEISKKKYIILEKNMVKDRYRISESLHTIYNDFILEL